MITATCYIDKYGFRRIEVSPPYEMVGWYFQSDVQESIYDCKDLFTIIKKVRAGIESEYTGTGNAYTITITDDNVQLEDEFSDPLETCEIPLVEFEKGLNQWFEFIKIGQEAQREWAESQLYKDAQDIAHVKEQRLQRKMMDSRKKLARLIKTRRSGCA